MDLPLGPVLANIFMVELETSVIPFGPVLANIFMIELETSVIPNLSNKVKLWKRFVDDTCCLARLEYIDNILLALNSFHKNIKFTFEYFKIIGSNFKKKQTQKEDR